MDDPVRPAGETDIGADEYQQAFTLYLPVVTR